MSSPAERPPVVAALLRVYSANIDWATGVEKDRRHLAHLLATVVGAVLIGVQEAKNLRLAAVVARPVRALQRVRTAARRGSGFVARGVRTSRFRIFLGGASRATLPRWIARVRVTVAGKPLVVFSAHVPPKRAGRPAQDRFLRALKRRTDKLSRRGIAWVACIDGNLDLQLVARYLGGTGYGADGDRIVGVIVSDDVIVGDHGVDRFGEEHDLTDHLAPWVDITGIR
ncbi:hypothetical protein [Pimelobacter simplex]|uniref:hypothetical protein n=1 Tax=Nocardioides simplex TaxID=2045 RepID=UPI003AAEE5D4